MYVEILKISFNILLLVILYSKQSNVTLNTLTNMKMEQEVLVPIFRQCKILRTSWNNEISQTSRLLEKD